MWNPNELHWRRAGFDKSAPTPQTPTKIAWDNTLVTALHEFLGEDIVVTTTEPLDTEMAKEYQHKKDVLNALVTEELNAGAGITDHVLWRAEYFRQSPHPTLTEDDSDALTAYEVTAFGVTCRCLLLTTLNYMHVYVRASEQEWWAVRANVAWDLFGRS
jgi:hypothetical protein